MYKVNLDKLIFNISRKPYKLPTIAYDEFLFLRSVAHITCDNTYCAFRRGNPSSAPANVTGQQTIGTVEG